MGHYTEEIIILGIIWFIGLTIGWCYRKSIILGIICTGVMAPILDLMIAIDFWLITLFFFLGVLTHTWKPLYNRYKTL